MDDAEISRFWADARVRGGLNPAGAYLGANVSETLPPPAWSFGSTPEEADRLLDLVLAGRKTATASALHEYEQEAAARAGGDGTAEGDTLVRTDVDVVLPEPGLLSIVLDGRDVPRALIRTTHVDVVRLGDVDEDHARREGEGSLEEWRRVHRQVFAETAPHGEVGDGTMVVLERFVVVVPATARRAAKRAGLL